MNAQGQKGGFLCGGKSRLARSRLITQAVLLAKLHRRTAPGEEAWEMLAAEVDRS